MIRGGGRSWVVTGVDADAVKRAAATLHAQLRASDPAATFMVESCEPDATMIAKTFDRIGSGACLLARTADPTDGVDGEGQLATVGAITDALVPMWPGAPLEAVLRRLVAVVSGAPLQTPSREEYAMAVAASAAVRSRHPERRVGAALTDAAGEIVASGVNDVPLCGGGFAWSDSADDDARPIQIRSSRTARASAIARIEQQLDGITGAAATTRALIDQAILPGMVDYGNAVHAETAALLDAARRGIQVAGTILYTTRYPCHACVRHALRAGVQSITWLWPIAREDARALHDATTCWPGEPAAQPRLEIRPFSGIVPRQYLAAHSIYRPPSSLVER